MNHKHWILTRMNLIWDHDGMQMEFDVKSQQNADTIM